MITYNHEKFIEEAINGVLMQECNFAVELIIANDCSTDQTDAVIQKIIQHHPKSSWIKYYKHYKNLGMMPNFIFAMQQCKGKYIALCEGDDYWTDPLKLQKQVDFLNNNEDYVACFHKANVISEDGNRIDKYRNLSKKGKVNVETIIMNGGGIYATASLLYRNILELPKFAQSTKAGDSALIYTLLGLGNIHFQNEYMCIYRKHKGGIYTSIHNNNVEKFKDISSNIKLLLNFRSYYQPKFQVNFNKALQKQLLRVSNNFGYLSVIRIILNNSFTLSDVYLFISKKFKNKIN